MVSKNRNSRRQENFYLCTGSWSRFFGLAACGIAGVLSVLRGIRSTARCLLDPHFSAEQFFSIHLGNSPVDVGGVLKGDEGITLATSEPCGQADFGTIQACQQGIGAAKEGQKDTYIFSPAKASRKSCSELL